MSQNEDCGILEDEKHALFHCSEYTEKLIDDLNLPDLSPGEMETLFHNVLNTLSSVYPVFPDLERM